MSYEPLGNELVANIVKLEFEIIEKFTVKSLTTHCSQLIAYKCKFIYFITPSSIDFYYICNLNLISFFTMKKVYFTMILLCALLVGCKPEPVVPTVATQEIEEVTTNSAKVVYNVVEDGGAEVASHGVCWSTSQEPTIEGNKTNEGNGVGTFASQLQDLESNTTYYVRPYAINSVGVSYGEEKSFTTSEEVIPFENKTVTVNGVTFTMVAVEGGVFHMGAQNSDPNELNYDAEAWDREAPVHLVTLSDYYIGETEVTQELWNAVMGSNPSTFVGTQRPVEQITWYLCQSFILELNRLTGMKFRFPTEAEWEFAAKGGNKSEGYYYSGSNIIDEIAWYSADGKKTHEVKTKLPNELGIYDMCGNVMEWCYDIFGDYSSESQTNPTGAPSGTDCIVRGGCCLSNANYCRTTIRSFFHPGGQSYGIGFRLALQAE